MKGLWASKVTVVLPGSDRALTQDGHWDVGDHPNPVAESLNVRVLPGGPG